MPDILYVSPTGSGIGTQAEPTSLTTAIASGKSFYMTDGIYTQDQINLSAGVVVRAVGRPVVVGADGNPPGVLLDNAAEIQGVWFGGTKPAESRFIDPRTNAKLYGCVFWNYTDCIVNAGDNNLIENCRFIACGSGSLHHPVYVSYNSVAGAVVQKNILINCDGYALHFFHTPQHGQVINNFTGGCDNALALEGTDHAARKNVFWDTTTIRLYLDGTAIIANNVFSGGTDAITPAEGQTLTGNHYIGDDWQEADIVSNLGSSSAQINAWIDAIATAFSGDVQSVHDAVIDFDSITGVLATWAAV